MPDPIIQRLPDTQSALQNKYRSNPSLYAGAPTPIANALLALDVQRASKGQNPLSVRQSQLALQAAMSGEAATPPPDKGFFESVTSDLGTILKSIPRLPAALYNEARLLPTIPTELNKAMAGGGGFVDQISRVAEIPGVRMIPGSYIAANLDDPGELLNHPLFTALDILPAKNIKVGGKTIGKRVSEPTKKALTPLGQQLGATRPGEFVREAFGTMARDVAQLEAMATAKMREAAYGVGLIKDNDPLTRMVREAGTLRKKYASITEERRRDLTKLMSEDDLAIRNLRGDELAFVNDSRRISDELGHYGVGQGLLQIIDGEVYDLDSAARILRARKKASVAQDYGDIRTEILTPTDVDSVATKIANVTKKEYLSPKDKVKLIEGYAHALEAQDINARPIFDKIRDYRNTKSPAKYSDDEFATWWEQTKDTLEPRREIDLESIIAQVNKHAATDPIAARIRDHLKAARFQEAQQAAKQAGRRKTYIIPEIDDLVYSLERDKTQARYFKSVERYDEKAVARTQKTMEKIEKRLAPARFHPTIDRRTQQTLIAQSKAKFSSDPDWDTIFQALQERNYSWLSREGYIPQAEMRAIQNDIRGTWQDLKVAGHDPVFVHKLSENQLGSIKYPRVLERIPRPSSTLKRSWNTSAHVDDISVALTHQGMEWLARRGSEEFIDTILSKWGKNQAEIIDRYVAAARKVAKSPDDVMAVAERMAKKEWAPYNPTNIVNWPAPKLKRWSDEQVWLPKTVANTIQRMHTPPGGRLTAISDPIMNVFRTSLLPLSPRWHVYNILGGGMVLTVGAGPQAWRFLKQAFKTARAGEVPEGVPRGIGTVPRDFLEWSEGSLQKPLEAIFQYKGGQTLRRLFDEAQGARTKFGEVIDASYKWNGIFDDMYRSMAYLQAESSALKKGLSPDQASKAGVELARKVFQQWDRMTPIERTIMRFIFPFYGWTSHVMKFALQYPFDHPIRTAIVGSFARNELDDMGSGLPERFLNMFFLGDTDENGNVKALNLAGMNPFSDVANNFTFAGFLGQTNPLISTAFQAAGVDIGNGGPELFPNMQYDAETGRLKFASRNPAMILMESIFPQSRVLTGFADASSEFQQLLRTNPEAAGRLLMSQAGLPVIFRTVNIPQEIAKSELARDESQSEALNQALKTGDWDTANNYPNLRPMLDQIRALQESGQLQSFTPMSAGQSAIGLAQSALSTQLQALPGMSPRQTP